jgi:serine/threonine-protein kinase
MKLPRIQLRSLLGNNPGLTRSTPFLLYVVVTLLVVILYLDRHDWLEGLELKIQDKMIQLGRQQGVPNRTVLVPIDNAAVDKIGEWPWDAERIGYLIGMLAEYKPAAIGLDFELPVYGEIDWEGNEFLSGVIQRAGNVITPLDFYISDKPISGATTPPGISKSTYIIADDGRGLLDYPPLQANHVRAPSQAVSEAAWNLGHVNSVPGPDGIVRTDPLVVKYAGEYYPSMAVQLVRAALDIHRPQMKINPGREVVIGHLQVPTDSRGRMLIEYWGGPHTFPSISAGHILEGNANLELIKGKVVIVGVTAGNYVGTVRTPASPVMHRSERIANAVESIMRKRFIAQANLTGLLELLILAAIGLFCGVVLPRITLQYRIVVLAVFLFIIINMNYILYSSFHLVTKTLYPSLEVLLFLVLSPLVKLRTSAADALDKQPATAARRTVQMPRVSSIGKPGQRSNVMRPARPKVRSGMITKEELAATQVITDDVIEDARRHGSRPPAGGIANNSMPPIHALQPQPPPREATPAPILNTPAAIPRQLGRYEVIELVGQGAMGTVYRGKDPAIDRAVALKTVRFGAQANAEESAELRERFYREARAVGRLSHPNIVTIYDVGNEGDLEYIAMEFVEGYTLEEVVKKKQALNYKILAKIVMQVCAALDYAHKQGIVHRDVKPANILVLDNFEIKVADFGIARLEQPNATMTQTGIALGTPSYISPEQLRGEKVDHRSDIFSLGVVIYELIAHQKPFTGENISQLIYNILNSDPIKPTEIDENIPGIFEVVTLRCLAKDPYERFQSVGEIAADLVDFVSSLSPKSYAM